MPFTEAQLDLFKNMPGLDDEDDTKPVVNEEADDTHAPDTTAEPADKETEAAATTKDTTSADTSGGTGSKDNVQTPAQPTKGTPRADGLIAQQDPSNPKLINLVDPTTGQVVVAAGAARRFYDNMTKAQREASTHAGRVQQLEQQVQAFTQANSAGAQYKLDPTEQTNAMRLMADFKANPTATLQRIVEEAQAAGMDLPFLQQQGIAPSVIEGIIDRKLQPILAPHQRAQEAAEGEAEAKKTLDTFLEANDTAEVHLPLLVRMLQSDGALTLDRAYTKLVMFAAEHGLDYRTPLEPQINQRQAVTGTHPSNTPASAERQSPTPRPLPNGRSASAGAVDVNDVVEHGGSESWETIIRRAMQK